MADETREDETGAQGDRPVPYRQAAGIVVSAGRDGSESRYFLKTAAGAVFSFGEHEHFLWSSFDGHTSFADLARAFGERFGQTLSPRDLAGFLAHAVQCGLLERDGDAAADFALAAAPAPGPQPPHRSPPRAHHSPLIGKEPWTVIVGDPTQLFAVLGVLFGPCRWIKWLSIPAGFISGMIVLKHLSNFQSDWAAVTASVPFWPCMYAYEHFLNIVARVTEGTIIQANGGTVRYFGLRFLLGVVIRGFIDEHAAKTLPKRVRIWSKAGVLLIRLAIFDIAIFIWISFRAVHPLTGRTALFVAVLSFILMCVNACPLVMAEGYEVLATWINQPDLAFRAFRLLGIRLSGRAAPPAMGAGAHIGLVLFSLGTILASSFVVLGILMDMGNYLTSHLQGLGYLSMTIVFLSAAVYIFALTRFRNKADATLRALATEAARGRAGSAQT